MKKITILIIIMLFNLTELAHAQVPIQDINSSIKRSQLFRQENDILIKDMVSIHGEMSKNELFDIAKMVPRLALTISGTYLGARFSKVLFDARRFTSFGDRVIINSVHGVVPYFSLAGLFISAPYSHEFYLNDEKKSLEETITNNLNLEIDSDLSLRTNNMESINYFQASSSNEKEQYVLNLISKLDNLKSTQAEVLKLLNKDIEIILDKNDPMNNVYLKRIMYLGSDQVRYKNLIKIGIQARIKLFMTFSLISNNTEAELKAALKFI